MFDLDTRIVTAGVRHHNQGSKAFARHGKKSICLKVTRGEGLPVSTPDECIAVAKKCLQAAITAKIPCSALFFKELDKQPTDVKSSVVALQKALDGGQTVWLSRRGALTVGVREQRKPKVAKVAVTNTKAEDEALAAFLRT